MAKNVQPKVLTYKEMNDHLRDLRERLLVWEHLHDYLSNDFLSMDGRPPKKHLAPDGMLGSVSEEAIEEVVESVATGPVEELKQKIAALESHVIPVQEGVSNGR
jgi:hypothetical protein